MKAIFDLNPLSQAVRRLLAGASPSGDPADPFRPPDNLQFEFGRFPFHRSVRYRIRKGWISRTTRAAAWPTWRTRSACRQPADDDWREFWQTIEPLRIWNWKRAYFDPPARHLFILDGDGWRFSCRRGRNRVKSAGGKYFPKLWRPEELDSRHDTLGLLQAALEALLSPAADSLQSGLHEREGSQHPSAEGRTD